MTPIGGNAWLVFTVPSPISTNALYRNTSDAERASAALRGRRLRGRAKTVSYQNWRELAGWEIRKQLGPKIPHCAGPFFIDITLIGGIDIDNLKCLPDLCKLMGIIKDDSPQYMIDLHVRQADEGECTVRIRPEGQWESLESRNSDGT